MISPVCGVSGFYFHVMSCMGFCHVLDDSSTICM